MTESRGPAWSPIPASGSVLTIGVVGARGGAGASTLAVLLAEAAAARTRSSRGCVLVQLGAGPAVDVLLGSDRGDRLTWPDLSEALGDVDPDDLAGALRRWRRIDVLGPDDHRPTTTPEQVERDVLRALRRGYRTVVIDLDRTAVLAGHAAAALDACDRVVIVVPRDIPAVAGAHMIRARLPVDLRLGLVTRGPAPGGLGGAEIATVLDLPWWADLPAGREVARTVDAGLGPIPGRRIARRLRNLLRDM